MMSSIEMSSVAQDMWDVIFEFDNGLDLKRLSSGSEYVAPASNENTPAHTAKPPAGQTTSLQQTTPTNHNQPIRGERAQRPYSVDLKGIISQFEEMPSSPIPLRNPSNKQPQIASQHGSTTTPTSPPIAIGRIVSPFITRKERDLTRAFSPDTQEHNSNGTTTPTSPVIGRIVSPFLTRKERDPTRVASPEVGRVTRDTAVPLDRRSSTPSQERPGSLAIPVITVNSAKSEVTKEAESSDDHLTTVSGHMTTVSDDMTTVSGHMTNAKSHELSNSEHTMVHKDQANGEPRGAEGSASGTPGMGPPTGPEEGAHKLCEGWMPHSSDNPLLSPPSPSSQWTSVSNVRNGEEDDDAILWMETPIDDHLVLMRRRVESEVLRRPAFQHDTIVPPSVQTHPLESPLTHRQKVRPSSLRRWRKKIPVDLLETSSEFTQCLSASEVQNLNQERLLSPECPRSKGSKLSSIWPKKFKTYLPMKEPTSPLGKKTHVATPSPKPNKHHHDVDFKLSNGGVWVVRWGGVWVVRWGGCGW